MGNTKKEESKISVIVPCYNVEAFVEKGIESIIHQSYTNIEIIVMEDCSTDSTYTILEKLQGKYPEKIKLYKNEKNGGLAYTRNRGVEKATGDYIGFIDPDDFIDVEFYKELLYEIKEKKADIAVANMILTDESGKPISEVLKCCDGEVTKKNIINNGLAASSCNKLFKKDLILKFPFLEGKINEDVAAIIPAIVHANGVAYADNVKYYYVQRGTSIQNSEFSEKRFQMFDAIKTCLERISDDNDYNDYKEILIYHQLLMMYVYVIIEQKDFSKRYKLIKEYITKQKNIKVYNNKLFKSFLGFQNKKMKIYYLLVVKLLKFRMAYLINIIISLRHSFSKIKKSIKLSIKRLLKINIVKQNLTIKDLEKTAKKQKAKKENKVKVSVVVPNYNYEKFLIERLYSILNQSEKVYEVIILDDCSKDNSRKLIDEIVRKLEKYINISKVYNEQNSGIAFKQWENGFKRAKGDYVWIAEADDYCDKNLLKTVLQPVLENSNVYISYVDTAFVNGEGNIFLKSIKPEIDIRQTGHWDCNYINNGIEEVKNYTFLNCTIANVSSCIIKREDYNEIFDRIIKYRQAGDWLFYVNVMARGSIAYSDKPLNYYRVHGENITSNMKKQKHLEEIKRIHQDIKEHFNLNEWHTAEMEKRYEFLTRVWQLDK